MSDPWQLPAVLLATDIDAALADYDQRVRAIRLQQPPAMRLLLVESLRTAMNCGPHPALSWIRGCERIRLDLVLLFGIRALFARFPFNNYALQFHHDAARIDFMTRTDTRMLVGAAIAADPVNLPTRRRNGFRRLRTFAPETQTHVVLMDASIAPRRYAPRLQPGETLGLVDIHTGQVQFGIS